MQSLKIVSGRGGGTAGHLLKDSTALERNPEISDHCKKEIIGHLFTKLCCHCETGESTQATTKKY